MPLQEEFESQGNFLFRYRSHLPLFLLLGGLAYFGTVRYINSVLGAEIYQSDLWLYLALVSGLIGLAIRVYTVGHTPKNTSGRNTGKQLADELNTSGIYSTVRHPLYLGNYFMWLAIAIMCENLWLMLIFSLIYWIYYERIMFAEEQFLWRKFGDNYLNWAVSTPAFIPSFKNYREPKIKFSWKKVLKKEKNGLFALFFLLFLFRTLDAYIMRKEFLPQEMWLVYLTVLSGILYFVLRTIKNRTKLLDEESR